jgi:hypothetical protein
MADTLTSLLNSTIQAGETELDGSLNDYLQLLEDGTYKVGGGTLTVTTTEDDLDTITGKYNNLAATLTSTAWFTGQETASQELIDFVTGLAQSGVYFAFDTDTVQFNSGPRTTVDCVYWDGDSVELQTFRAVDDATYATAFTEGYTTVVWDTNKQSVLGMTLAGTDNLTLTIV